MVAFEDKTIAFRIGVYCNYNCIVQATDTNMNPSFDKLLQVLTTNTGHVITQQIAYNFPRAKFETISLPVTQVILHRVGKSNVLVNPSAKPKPNMGGIHPLAYSSAKQALSILYCFTVPRWR